MTSWLLYAVAFGAPILYLIYAKLESRKIIRDSEAIEAESLKLQNQLNEVRRKKRENLVKAAKNEAPGGFKLFGDNWVVDDSDFGDVIVADTEHHSLWLLGDIHTGVRLKPDDKRKRGGSDFPIVALTPWHTTKSR